MSASLIDSYSEKLKDANWDSRRREILKRDGFMCQRCCATDTTLQVHHCYYDLDKEPWEYEDRSLISLCRSCHEQETRFLKYTKTLLCDSISKKGALANNFEQLAFAFECSSIWPNDKVGWAALAWAIRTPAIMNTIISHYRDFQDKMAVQNV